MENYTSTASYRVPIGLQFVWGLIIFTGGLVITESPRWLVKQDRFEDATTALSHLRNLPSTDPLVQAEINEIRTTHEYEMSLGVPSYIELFRGTMAPRTWVGINVQMFQQLTGVNFVSPMIHFLFKSNSTYQCSQIFYYGTAFFISAGIEKPYLITVATGVVNVAMTIPGILLVERAGRRKVLLFGALIMAICQLIVGATSVGSSGPATNNVLVAFTCLFIATFASTWGPCAWVLSTFFSLSPFLESSMN